MAGPGPTRRRFGVFAAALIAALLVSPQAAAALALRVAAQVPLVTDVPLEVAPGDPGGLALLYCDGRLVGATTVSPSTSATFCAVALTPGGHRLRAVLRSRGRLTASPSTAVAAWGQPAPPRLSKDVGALSPKLLNIPVYVSPGTEKLTLVLDGNPAWSKVVAPPVTVTAGMKLTPGVHTAELRATNPVGSASTCFTTTRPTWPLPGYYGVSSGFGYRDGRLHKGMDVLAPWGTPVVAAAAGTVIWAKPLTSYGGLVMIDHGGRMTTYYAHLSAIDVRSGQQVVMGQRVGRVGTSNVSHLHFQLFTNADNADPDPFRRVNSGTPVDPYPYVLP